ncbi:MAG: hypothetical protein ACI4MG_05945 [Aristaeellaceae bacterium]
MKLCFLCHWLLTKRRWLLLPVGAALAFLLCLILPRHLGMALSSLPPLIASMLLIYLRDLSALRSSRSSRVPAPHDGQAEIIMIDASLVDTGVELRAAAQPLNACPELSLRMGSGALLLGTAMVFLADELPPADGDALLLAAARMNLHVQTLRSRSPILVKGTENGMRCVTVQDGAQERSYFMADAETTARGCSAIWEDRIRLMGQNDRTRILDAARYMAAGGCRVLAFATAADDEPPVFLGLAALGDGLQPEAVEELQEMRAMGLTPVLRDDEAVPLDIAALRQNLDVPDLHARPDLCLSTGSIYPDDHCLTILMQRGDSLLAPVRQLREHFACMAQMLRHLARVLGTALACCCIAGGYGSLFYAAVLLFTAYLSFGNLVSCRSVRRPGMLLTTAGCLLCRLLMDAAVPGAANAAGTALCIALTCFIALTLTHRGQKLGWAKLLPLPCVATGAIALTLLTHLPLSAALLLPMGFGLVCGSLLGMLLLLTER